MICADKAETKWWSGEGIHWHVWMDNYSILYMNGRDTLDVSYSTAYPIGDRETFTLYLSYHPSHWSIGRHVTTSLLNGSTKWNGYRTIWQITFMIGGILIWREDASFILMDLYIMKILYNIYIFKNIWYFALLKDI